LDGRQIGIQEAMDLNNGFVVGFTYNRIDDGGERETSNNGVNSGPHVVGVAQPMVGAIGLSSSND
jgi:hypothetical protein